MQDLKTQLSTYIEGVVQRVDVDEALSQHTVELQPARRRMSSGWMIGLGTATVVILLGLVSFLMAPSEPTLAPPVNLPPPATTQAHELDDPFRSVPPEEEILIAQGVFEGSSMEWRMTAWTADSGTTCVRLGGVSCFSIPEDRHLSGLFITEPQPGGQAGWCGYGTVTAAASVQLRLPDGSTVEAPIYSNPEFEDDFFAHCQLGDQPTEGAAALAADGTILQATSGFRSEGTSDSSLNATPKTDIPDVDIRGQWTLVEFTSDGERQPVELGLNAQITPVIEITDQISGTLGCNTINQGQQNYTVNGNVLSLGDVYSTARVCGSIDPDVDLMAVDDAFLEMRMSDNPIVVDVSGNQMTWTNGETSFWFVADCDELDCVPPESMAEDPSSWLGETQSERGEGS